MPSAHPQARLLAAISLGGMVGASARYALELAWPPAPNGLPWATLLTNALGCLLIGVLMVFVVERGGAHPLLRPFAGVGVLGGFTTFSTYAVQVDQRADQPALALAYLAVTPLAALLAVAAGVAGTRALFKPRRLTLRGNLARRRADSRKAPR
jgi:CrcB protein